MVYELSCVDEVQVTRDESKEDSASKQPWLLISDGEDCHIETNMFNNKPPLDHDGEDYYYDVGGEIPEFVGRYIGCSHQEWVLLYGIYDDGLPHALVNLLSKETIELPLMDFQFQFCILTSPPTDPTCHIVFFHQQKNSLIIWQPGQKEYTTKQWDHQDFPCSLAWNVAGKLFLHTLQEMFHLVMVEFQESTYRSEVVQIVDIKYVSTLNYYFEYSGELFIVYKIMSGRNVAGFTIFKADLLNEKWVRIKNLGRLAVFIGLNTFHAHCAPVDSAANSIYFLEDDDPDSYFVYNLEEGTVRMKPIFSTMETTEDTKLHWIMMPCDPPFPKVLKIPLDQENIQQDSEKENGEVEQDEVQESWNTVPPELLDLIQSRLFGRDHAVFRGVCKAWKQASIQDYSISSLLSSERLLEQCQSSSPLLMYQEDRTSFYNSVPIFRFFDPVHRKLYRIRIPELKEAVIHYSRDGWLLVSRSCDESIFFFNPLTREKIELPRMPSHHSIFEDFLSFCSPPTCSNCLVVGIDRYGSTLYTLKHGDETWREHLLDYFEEETTEDMREYLSNVVVINGLHYFMCDNRYMVIFNLKNGAEDQVLDPESRSSKFRRPEYLRGEDFLVEIDGGPACVSFSPDGGEISIFRWNDVVKDWELMEGDVEFGGKEMFLSRRCSFMEKIDDVGGIGNNIFLPMIDDAKDGVFYSLATEKYHTFYSGYSSEFPYDVDKFWMVLGLNLTGKLWVKTISSGSFDKDDMDTDVGFFYSNFFLFSMSGMLFYFYDF